MNDNPSQFKVWVRCVTFNHAPYITATFDGFCQQQTNFPFVCIIIDDASKDGEQDIIRQYLCDHFTTESIEETDDYHLTMARHRENKNCYFAAFLLKYNHYSINKSIRDYYQKMVSGVDYYALCEGDDYWTDALKLQKQADALDANPQAVMVYTDFRNIDAENKPITRPKVGLFSSFSHSGDNLPTLFRYGNYVMTLTTMYRSKVLQTDAYKNCPYNLDLGLSLAAAIMGDFIWLPEQTANYRLLQSGMIKSNRLDVRQKIQEIYRYYAKLLMNGQCKPMSLGRRINLTTHILMRALKKKDQQLKKDTLRARPLSCLLLPIAFIRLKIKR